MRTDTRESAASKASEVNAPLTCYLHIYKVIPANATDTSQFNYVSVASLGQTRAQAEQVAINLVHQRNYHIIATDTATEAPWLTQDEDLPYLIDLQRYGAALQELAA